MAVGVVKGAAGPGHPGLGAVTVAVRTEATILISELKVELVRLIGRAVTLRSLRYCRIDRQPPPSGGVNLQVQLNGKTGDSSVATCVVGTSVIESLAPWPPGLRKHQEGWLTRRIRRALTDSLDNGHVYHITGSFHDEDTPPNLTPRKGEAYRNRRGVKYDLRGTIAAE